jgi:hypothetical protein
LNSAAEARAFAMSRRDSAASLHVFAKANPGISRRTACKPNPRIPKRTIGKKDT